MQDDTSTTKLTLTNEYGTYAVESYQSCDHISEVINHLVVPVLLATGWQPKTIKDYITTDVC